MWYINITTVPKNETYSDYLDSFYETGLSFDIDIVSTTSKVSWTTGRDFESTYIWAFSSQ